MHKKNDNSEVADVKVLAIRTDFSHHGEYSGYKQLLKFTKPLKIIGLNERDPDHPRQSVLLKKYPWLFEFFSWKYRKEVDLVHILYAEDYFRWSSFLFRKIPVVATFHQPAEMLEREVLYGDFRGRIGKLTHRFSKNRFKNLSAAIITNPSQADVLKKVMSPELIHHIPLGIYFDKIKEYREKNSKLLWSNSSRPLILTVGVWLRDWEFYFQLVRECPEFEFALVNKRFDKSEIENLKQFQNLKYYENISDVELYELFSKSNLHFLPVTGFAGSNAFLQGLALGCPVLMTDINANEFRQCDEFICLYEKGNIHDAILKMRQVINLSEGRRLEIGTMASKFAEEFSWEKVAEKTLKLYRTVI